MPVRAVLRHFVLAALLAGVIGCNEDRASGSGDGSTTGPPVRHDVGSTKADTHVADAAAPRDATAPRDVGGIGPADARVMASDVTRHEDAAFLQDLGVTDAMVIETSPLRQAYLPVARRFCDELFECSRNYGTPPGTHVWWHVAGCCERYALRRTDCATYVLDTLQGFAVGCRDSPDDRFCDCTSQRDCLQWMQTVECRVPDELIVWPLECMPGRRRHIADPLEQCCGDDFAPCDPNRPPVGPIDGFFPPPPPADAGPPQ